MSTKIINEIRSKLIELSDEKTRISGARFFKEKVKLHGVQSKPVAKLAKEYQYMVLPLGKEKVLKLCDELWTSGFIEESFIACHWALAHKKEYTPEDFDVFEYWIHNYVTNWASCDTLCNHTVAECVMAFPALAKRTLQWAKSENRWVKRAAAVTYIIPARKGMFTDEIFRIANVMLHDPDDMVQKGYGWMLKAYSQYDPANVFSFIMEHKSDMPRTAFRYAIEKMPENLRKKAMAK
jgi:3-methyladenine DNA glycosylase AlkD